MKNDINYIYITGIKFHNITKQEFHFFMNDLSENSGMNVFIVTPNVDFVIRADKDDEFREIINHADFSVCDSAVIYHCSKLLCRNKLKDKITGFDAMTALLEIANQRKEKIFLLGSTENNVRSAAENIEKTYKNLTIAGIRNGFFDIDKDTESIIKDINKSGAKYLFIGMGSPRQEKWAYKFKNKLYTNFIISVGGLFDIYSGKTKRAPLIFQHIGMEWFWRFLNDPSRLFKRYFIEDMRFFYLLSKQFFRRNKQP